MDCWWLTKIRSYCRYRYGLQVVSAVSDEQELWPPRLKAPAKLGVDLLLAGHMHTTLASSTAKRYPIEGYSALVIQAGTATSTRGRGEENSFNVLRLQADRVEIERHAWGEEHLDYRAVESFAYAREGESWHEVPRV